MTPDERVARRRIQAALPRGWVRRGLSVDFDDHPDDPGWYAELAYRIPAWGKDDVPSILAGDGSTKVAALLDLATKLESMSEGSA